MPSSSKSLKKDCYLIDLDQNLLGPYTAEEAAEKLLLAPFGWLLLRAGFCPIWSEDLEGLELVLKSIAGSDFQISPPPPPLPVRVSKATQAPLPLMKSLFHARAEFEVSCTKHFENQKRWFEEKKREALNAHGKKEKGQARAEQAKRMLREKKDVASVQPLKVLMKKFMLSKDSKKPTVILPLGLLAVAIVGLIYTAINLSGRMTGLSESPYANFDAAGSQALERAGSQEFPESRAPAIEKSLSAKGPAALKQLTRVIEAKLEGNFPKFAKELLSLLPYHKIFQDDLIPPPQTAAAFAVLFLNGIDRENHPSWKPLQNLLGSELKRGLTGKALLLRRLEDLAATVSGIESDTQLMGLEAMLRSRSLNSQVQSGSGDVAVYSPKTTPPERVYWGARKPGPALTSRMVHDAFDEIVSLLSQLGNVAGVGRSDYALRDYMVTRAQGLAAWFVLGLGQPALTKKLQPVFESQLENVGDQDSAILSLLLNEATADFAAIPLRTRVEKRFALMRKLHIEGSFFCRPLGSILGLDFIAQSLRLALVIDFPLPQLGSVFTNCLVTPAVLLPTRRNNFFSEQEKMLDLLPAGASTNAYEWNELSQALKTKLAALVASGASLSFSNEWQWYALLSFGSADAELQNAFAQASLPFCKGQSDLALDAFCLLVRWRQTSDQQFRQKKELLNQMEARYGMESAQELAFQWAVRTYLSESSRGRLPGDPLLLARRYETERFFVTARPHFNCLEWLAKHGVN